MLPDLQDITLKTARLAMQTGGFLRGEVLKLRSTDIERKSFNNFVTYVDRESENRIVEQLGKILPGLGFIAEENPSLSAQEFTWVIQSLGMELRIISMVFQHIV